MLRPARLPPPQRLLTPRLARRLSATNRGLLPGAPVPTRTGLPPAGLIQLSGRTMAPTLGGRGGRMLLRNCSLPRAPGSRPARPGHHHRLAGGHAAELVVVAGAVHRRRLADELSEAGGEGAEARTADRETDV